MLAPASLPLGSQLSPLHWRLPHVARFPLAVRFCHTLFALCVLNVVALSATGPRELSLYDFSDIPDGAFPTSNLIASPNGHFYGTTQLGGTGTCILGNGLPNSGCGTVFELIPPTEHGGTWTEKVLYSFQDGDDGALPEAGLVLDKAGNLYGTTSAGGDSKGCALEFGVTGCGTVFQLSRPESEGGTWTEKIIYAFQGQSDGAYPTGGLVFDGEGRLYGTTQAGGIGNCSGSGEDTYACGMVFRLTQSTSGNSAWSKEVLHSFNGSPDGMIPAGSLVFDKKGNLYGTTAYGGGDRCSGDWNEAFCGGIAFELSPPSTEDASWTETILVTFYGLSDGATIPGASVILDNENNLYGTTVAGGNGNCGEYEEFTFPSCGVVFQLSPPKGQGSWTYSEIYSFSGTTDGAYPANYGTASLVLDEKGNLYGTAPNAGNQPNCSNGGKVPESGCGTVWELTPPSAGEGAWTETTLYAFTGGSDGGTPYGGIYFKDGVLLGTTSGIFGPTATSGTVFAVVP